MADDREESVPGLQQLDPSPVDETPSSRTTDDYFPRPDDPAHLPALPPRSHPLGLSHHSPIWYLSRIQQYSTYAFTAFGLAHLANTALIPLLTRSGPESERYVLLTRPYYQGVPAEPVLVVVPLCAHVLAGVALRVVRRNAHAARSGGKEERGTRWVASLLSDRFWPRVSGPSRLGYALVPLVLGHVVVNRAIPGGWPGGQSNVNLSYVGHAFARHPVVSWVGFAALIGVGVFHVTWGWARWLGWMPEQVSGSGGERGVRKRRRWCVINGVAAAVTGLWVAGGMGVIGREGEAPGYVGRMYDEMYRRIPVVGRWM